MDFNEIKKIIEADGGKFIFIEDGKPTMVVCGFEEYKKKLFIGSEKNLQKSLPASAAPKALQVGLPVRETLPRELREDELKIDDLPL